jgi:hypothetical protein
VQQWLNDFVQVTCWCHLRNFTMVALCHDQRERQNFKNDSFQRFLDGGYRLIWYMKIGVLAELAMVKIIRL